MEIIDVKNVKDIKIEKGDFFSKQFTKEGEPQIIVVIPKNILGEVESCLKEYSEENTFGRDEINETSTQLDWLLSMLVDTKMDSNSIKAYKVIL